MRKAVIVYQKGIANVFDVDCFNMANYGRNAKRLLQGSFSECEAFCRGLEHAGYDIRPASCNSAGDIAQKTWKAGLSDCPFKESAKINNTWRAI